ncbi:hypothetical protein [Labilibaculum euxinus]|uniref:Uncharacterized protein n=1 Tax=Labilibaculum euxinus TaxID=2686357 RepID=A0A7M4D6G5_9BACT|nr:hypothetical protein [Labilibaculum euxinus]MUP38244.1 hypothetical protein [Labilibaculum euxinus]MVB07449.1 hypothetical protein [Labilibaculum euxinus]
MKYYLLSVLLAFFFSVNLVFSQCLDFAKEHCKPKLENYIHDGNYNGVVLNKDEEVELHKAFFSGQKYRVVVGCEDEMPTIHFKITDSDLNLIFDNEDSNYTDFFDFELDEAKTLIISLDFVKNEDTESEQKSGCVSILFGLRL